MIEDDLSLYSHFNPLCLNTPRVGRLIQRVLHDSWDWLSLGQNLSHAPDDQTSNNFPSAFAVDINPINFDLFKEFLDILQSLLRQNGIAKLRSNHLYFRWGGFALVSYSISYDKNVKQAGAELGQAQLSWGWAMFVIMVWIWVCQHWNYTYPLILIGLMLQPKFSYWGKP